MEASSLFKSFYKTQKTNTFVSFFPSFFDKNSFQVELKMVDMFEMVEMLFSCLHCISLKQEMTYSFLIIFFFNNLY